MNNHTTIKLKYEYLFKTIASLFALAIFIFFPALGSTHDQSWEAALKQALDSGNQPQIIPREDLSDCHSISVIMGSGDVALGRRLLSGSFIKLAYEIATELGLVDHLAPQVSINGVCYEKFIRLFDTPDDEEMMNDNSTASKLKAIRGKHGDLSVLRLIVELGTQKCETLSKTEIKELSIEYNCKSDNSLVYELGREESSKVLNLVDAGSVDELFLYHILTSAADPADRNFLLQYRGGKLHLVRIDYGDSLFCDTTEEFLGKKLLTALTTTFSAKGRQIINRLSDLSPKLALWKNYISKSLMQTKKEKSLYLERINALKLLNDAGFFEHNHRAHTMLVLYYLGLRDQLNQRSMMSLVDNSWGNGQYDIVDNEGQSLKDFTKKLKKSVKDCCIKYDHVELLLPSSFVEVLASSNFEEFLHITRCLFLTRTPFNNVLIKQAIKNWMAARSISDLPGIKEFLQSNEDPFSMDHLTSWGNITSVEAQRQRIQAIPHYLHSEPLNSTSWGKIREEIHSCLGESSVKQDFISIALSVVMQKGLIDCTEEIKEQWKSFMQQRVSKKSDANELWKTFLQNCDSFGEFKKDIAMPVRVIEIARMFEEEQATAHRNASFINSKEIEDMQTIQLTLLATGGTFGMNFNRTANFDEAAIMIGSLESLGRNLLQSRARNLSVAANEITDALFVAYSSSLREFEKFQLRNHQLNCATIALHSVFEGDFDAIDKHFHSKSGSSKQRHTQIMRMAGRSVEDRDEL